MPRPVSQFGSGGKAAGR